VKRFARQRLLLLLRAYCSYLARAQRRKITFVGHSGADFRSYNIIHAAPYSYVSTLKHRLTDVLSRRARFGVD